MNSQELWEAGFCSINRMGVSLALMEGWSHLVWIVLWVGQGTKPATQKKSSTALDPFDKEGCLARGSFLWMQRGEGNLQRNHWRPPWFYQMSSGMRLNLNFRSYIILWLWVLQLHLVTMFLSVKKRYDLKLMCLISYIGHENAELLTEFITEYDLESTAYILIIMLWNKYLGKPHCIS